MKTVRILVSSLLVLSLFTLSGCGGPREWFTGMDGKVDSAVTGEYSTQAQIENAARTQAADFESMAGAAASGMAQLQVNYDSDIEAVGGENASWNRVTTNGLGITTTLISMAAPQAMPFVNGVLPLFADLLMIGGIGGVVHTRAKKSGAKAVAEQVSAGAKASPAFREEILTGAAGAAMSSLLLNAPKSVQAGVRENLVEAGES